MVRRAHQQQYRRIEPDVGVLSCASASRGADRGAAQVRWRPAMCCDDYPGAVVLTAPSNKRLKLAARVVYRGLWRLSPRRCRDTLHGRLAGTAPPAHRLPRRSFLDRCLSLDALLMEIRRDGTSHLARRHPGRRFHLRSRRSIGVHDCLVGTARRLTRKWSRRALAGRAPVPRLASSRPDRKSTRLNSSHLVISYAVFCLKKKKKQKL